MKKVFPLTSTQHVPARQLEAVKGEVRKYLKRERKKRLAEDMDYWDFDCKLGLSSAAAAVVHVAELPQRIAAAQAAGASECYIEILAKPAKRGVRAAAQ
jgi:hypothetical protein